MDSEIIAELVQEGETRVVGAIYNIESGAVEFYHWSHSVIIGSQSRSGKIEVSDVRDGFET